MTNSMSLTGPNLSSGDIYSIILECPFGKCHDILMGEKKKLHLLPSIPKVIKWLNIEVFFFFFFFFLRKKIGALEHCDLQIKRKINIYQRDVLVEVLTMNQVTYLYFLI